MLPNKVDSMLKEYRFFVGRCGHLETEIANLEQQITYERSQIAGDLASPTSAPVTGMPHGSKASNPTERTGLMLASGYTPPHIIEMEQALSKLRQEYNEKYSTVLFVGAWLKGLTEKERWIVEQQVIDAVFWKEIVIRFRTAFGEDCSKDSLKRLKQRALGKIYKMAE